MFCSRCIQAVSIRLSSRRLAIAALLLALVPVAARAELDPTNPVNPYDSAGADHNRALEAAIAGRSTFGADMLPLLYSSFDRIYDHFCATPEGSRDPDPCPGLARVPSPEHMRLIIDPAARERLIRNSYDTAQLDYYQQILAAVATEDAAVGIDRIRRIEAEIMASLSREKAEPLLGMASVARFSLSYWEHEASLGAESAYAFREGAHPGSLDLGTLREISGADASGFFVGFAVAGPLGGYYGVLNSLYAAIFDIVLSFL